MEIVLFATSIFFFGLWLHVRNERNSEKKSKEYWKTLYETEKKNLEAIEREKDYFKELNKRRYDNVLRLQKENAALQKQLKELTPQTPQEPWWTEED